MTVQRGDVFEDLDPRVARRTGPRQVLVVKVIGDKCMVEDEDTGLRTHIRTARLLRGGSRGYRKVEP